jgi:triosephosphate isomerase
MSRTPLLAGNWKMNLNHLEAIAFVQKLAYTLTEKDYAGVEVAVLPPFTDIRSVQTMVDGDRLQIIYGAQDLSPHDSGAYTGDIGGPMLAKLGCTYVCVGHSERREYHAESDEVVNAKVLAAVRNGLVPILCVGERLDVRREGGQVAHTTAQLRAALAGVPADKARTLVIAYEPVWAIGTGEVATPQDAQEVCAELRSTLADVYSSDDAFTNGADGVRILYGGSVKPDNVAAIMAEPDVDGALVGGASLSVEDFAAIVRFARPEG